MRKRNSSIILGLLLATVCAFLLALSLGAAGLPVAKVAAILAASTGLPVGTNWSDSDQAIVLLVRLPRVILAMLVGSGLAASGAAFQGLFRNPMADPYVLGVSPGAALGATIAIIADLNYSLLGLSAVPLFAFGGGILTALGVYTLSSLRGRVSVPSLLLTGIAAGSLLSAFTSLAMVMAQRDLQHVFFWIMGGLSGRTWSHVYMVLPYWLVGLGLLGFSIRDLNLLLLGEEEAYHLGINVERAKTRILAAGALTASVAVSAAGIVGFVGLIVPHTVRLLTGPDHRLFLPAATLAGALCLLLADMAARLLLSPEEIPLGVVTALLGAPFFIYLLRRKAVLS